MTSDCQFDASDHTPTNMKPVVRRKIRRNWLQLGAYQLQCVSCERHFIAIASALLAILAALQIGSAIHESSTNDETSHLATGYAYLTTGEYSMELKHPPLGRILAALPLLLLPIQHTPASGSWAEIDKLGAEIDKFLWQNPVPGQSILFRARLVVITLTVLLGAWLAWWTRRYFGAPIALLALTFFAFDPNIIAHGHYVTTDLIGTLGIFVAVTLWASFLFEPSWKRLVAAAIGLGLALVSKYSAIFLLLVLPLLYFVAWWRNRGRRFFTWRGAIVVFVVMCLGAVSIIALIYGPQAITRFRDLRARGYRAPFVDRVFGAGVASTTRTSQTVAALGRAAAEPAYAYVGGLKDVIQQNAEGQQAYLLGQFRRYGWWHYFPVAFAVKTPTAVLVAGLLALLSLLSMRTTKVGLLPLCLTLPPVVFFLLSIYSTINIGVRHILPIYPFLYVWLAFVLVGYGARLLRNVWLFTVVGLIVTLCVESLLIYPQYLAFFNWPSGGPVNGSRYLLDSNIDWGQDFASLKRYADDHQAKPLCTALTAAGDLRHYGVISRDLLRTGIPEGIENLSCVVAVSVNVLNGLYVPPSLFAPLRQRDPVARIGYSIYVFDLRR